MKTLTIFTLLFLFVSYSFSAPLIFKAQKEVKFGNKTELGTFDASKYKQIRIEVRSITYEESQKNPGTYSIGVTGLEENEEIDLAFKMSYVATFIIDSPPPKVRVDVIGQGNYRLYVYGSQ